jgi:hypothetical protein
MNGSGGRWTSFQGSARSAIHLTGPRREERENEAQEKKGENYDQRQSQEVLVTITPELLRDYGFCVDWRGGGEGVKNFLDNLSKG